ncbi:hypothetical protein ACVGWB_01580, partial [Enterobacter mori]
KRIGFILQRLLKLNRCKRYWAGFIGFLWGMLWVCCWGFFNALKTAVKLTKKNTGGVFNTHQNQLPRVVVLPRFTPAPGGGGPG